MTIPPKKAVIADTDAASAHKSRQMLSSFGFHACEVVTNAADAMKAITNMRPDALLTDAVLLGSDGAALCLSVLASRLTVYPLMLIVRVPGFYVHDSGKLIDDGCVILDKPIAQAELERALSGLDPAIRRVPERISRGAEALLMELGVPEHEGRIYLNRAIGLTYLDTRFMRSMTKRLYPAIGKTYGANASKVERSMRYAIEHAWKHGNIDKQYGIFGSTIDAQRGKPTCGEMIAQLANILRMEGF